MKDEPESDGRPATSSFTLPRSSNLPPSSPVSRFLRSFYFAFAGLAFLFRTQRNARIHACLGAVACALALWLRVSRVEWAVLVFTIALVLILEGLNTAVEAAIDLASPQVHPLAKAAKDLAAGMVLIAAMASVAVGLLILGPPLWRKFVP
jgi:diacylglycerol kinase